MAQRQYCLIVESRYGSERGVEAVYGPATASWAQDYQSVLRSRLRGSQDVSVTIAELQPVPPPR